MLWLGVDLLRGVTIILASLALICTTSSGYELKNESLVSNERKLFRYLMEDYEKTVRPVAHESEAVQLKIGLSVTSIEDLDELTGAFYTNGWLRLTWHDIQLQWDKNEHGGIDVMRLPASEIWTPDVVVANSMNAENSMPMAQHLAVVTYDGEVTWMPSVSFRTHCAIDMTDFPFDKQTCSLKFLSWTYDENLVNLTHWYGEDDTQDVSLVNFGGNHKWIVEKVTARRNSVYYACCPERYVDITFDIQVRRASSFAVHLFLAPSVTLSLIIPAVFLLPPGSTDKMVMGIGVLIAHVLLLGEFIQYLPSEHFKMPYMGQFFLANVVLVGLSLALSAIISNIWTRGRSRLTGPPDFIRVIFLGPVFTRLLFVDFDDYADETGSAGMNHWVSTSERPGSLEAMSDFASNRTSYEDRVNIVLDGQQRMAQSDWRRLAIVLDRLFFVVFLLLVIAICLAYAKYL